MTAPPFSHDAAVKNLLRTYPDEALEFLAQDITTSRGMPTSWDILDTGVLKDDTAEPGPGMAMDLAIRYNFHEGSPLLLVLVEHWSDAARLDLLRTARYYIDLRRRFPSDEILPISLVDDNIARPLEDTWRDHASGTLHFHFHTRIVQIPALAMDAYRHTRNRVALSFTPNMSGCDDPVEQIFQVTAAFHDREDMAGVRTFFAFWVVEGRLNAMDQRRLNNRLKENEMPVIMEWLHQEGLEKGLLKGMQQGLEEGMVTGMARGMARGLAHGMEKGIEQGIEQGIEKGIERGIEQGRTEGVRRKALEDARRLRDHGVSWDIITDVTGLTPPDLEEHVPT